MCGFINYTKLLYNISRLILSGFPDSMILIIFTVEADTLDC